MRRTRGEMVRGFRVLMGWRLTGLAGDFWAAVDLLVKALFVLLALPLLGVP